MALVVKDRVKEITTTTGTSDLTLGGAVYGFQSFSIIGNGNTTYYGIYDSNTGDWEVGVGTYTTAGPTLTRTTVFESSNSGSKVVFGAGSKDVFVTYPAERAVYLDAAGSAVTVLDIGTAGIGTANITTANITAGTISTTPTASNDIANKSYVDGIAAQGITYHTPVKYEVPNTTGNLNALYNNGASGVGATLTNNGTKAAFAPDGPTAQVGDRILVYSQTNAFENGIYEVTTVGTPDPGGTNWVLTRTADADSYGLKDPNAIGQGDAFYVTSGNTGAGETYVVTTAGTITFGTTAITFAQISSAQVYSAGTGLTLSNLVFSITPVGTASTYGSASQVPVFTTNASGQVTSVTNTGIAISAAAVSGLAPSATTDTTNASNITSGTLGSARLTGSYTGITGVGTLTAGTWTATAIGAAYGGTGLTSYTVGDLLYADGTTSLAKLADVVTGNALISGGVGTAPAWGKIGLQTHITGTLQLVNGGTGATDASGARSNLGLVIGTDIPSVTGSGASGTWGINITGNAATATTSTTSTTATQVSNSVTFNNSGAGAASGNGFNGSGALTVSYNTIGAPSTTGANASGTWGISITGGASSAGYSTYLITQDIRTLSPSSTAAYRLGFGFTSWANNNTAPYADYLALRSYSDASGGNDNLLMFNKSTIAMRLYQQSFGSASAYASYADVLMSNNFNSYAPTLTGGGASGTWGINITGSAGSATTATTANALNTANSYTGAAFTASSSNAYLYANRNSIGSGQVGIQLQTAGVSKWWMYLDSSDDNTLRWYNSINSTNVLSLSNAGSLAATGDMRAPIFYDSNNTGYYVDPASNSVLNTINGRSSDSFMYYQGFTLDANTMNPNATGFTYAVNAPYTGPIARFSTGGGYDLWLNAPYTGGNNIAFRTRNGDTGTLNSWRYPVVYDVNGASGALYGTIYYDQNNTGYYVDPASTSNLYALTVNQAISGSVTGYSNYVNWQGRIPAETGRSAYYPGVYTFSTFTTSSSGNPPMTYAEVLAWGGGGSGAIQIAGDWISTTNTPLYVRSLRDCCQDWSSWTQIATSGVSFTNSVDLRAPIFYDSNNTGYYVDPASVSYLYGLTLAGGSYFRPNNWIQFDSSYGLYWPNNNNAAELNANTSSSYGAIRLVGSRNGWDGFYSTFSAVNGFMYASNGNGGVYREANDRWYWYYHLSNDCMGIGTASTSSTYSLYLNKGVYAQSRIDATIFYDTNDTSYYLNPNSTSSLHSATCWSTWYFRANTNTGSGSNPPLQAYSDNGSGAIMSFHRGGYYAVNMGLDSDNVLRIGGWSAPANLFQMDMSGNLTMAANVTAYSDERLKKDWSELPEDFVERLAAVKNGTYTRTDANMRQVGVGAQSLQGLLPEAVLDGEYLSVAYGNAALAACVELAKSVVALRAELNALRAQ